MKVAVTYESGEVFQHFGHTARFAIYEVDDEKVLSESIVDTCGQGHGALAEFLKAKEVNVLICGGIGSGAKEALDKAGIKIYGGVKGSAEKAIRSFLHGTLIYNPHANCNHSDHSCGDHSCSAHSCETK